MGPKSVDEIYEDFKGRRDALVQALTEDAEDFYEGCDPTRENLCLYGNPDGAWRVDLPAAEVPPELPEPVLGINFARDGMERKDWLALCAVHSDAWLMSVLFFYAARFDDAGRAQLFSLVNQHPTVYEVVTGRAARAKMYKRKHVGGPRHGGPGAQQAQQRGPQQAQQAQQQQQQQQQQQHPTESRVRSGRLMTAADVGPQLVGRQGELYWPDDSLWYLVAVQKLDLTTRQATVQYATGEEETLDIDDVVREGQISLLG